MKRLLFTIAVIATILFSLPHKAHATFSYYCLGRDCSETVYSCLGPDCQWLSGDFTSTWYTGSYQIPYDMSFDGTYFTITNTDTTSIKLVNYGANVPSWGADWTATSGPHVIPVTNGSLVLAPCGYFQADLLPSYATVYDSPSYTGDRYGNPGDGVLLASANGGRICASAPAPTATPTSAPTVISAPTGVTVGEGDANGGATIQTRSVKVTWAFPDAGAGCGGAWANTCPSSTTKFYIRFTGPSSVPQGQIASTGTRAYTTGASLTTNGTYTVNVCANNGTQEKCTAASFTKVPYPTGVLSGQLYERSPSVVPIACYAGARALYAGTVTLVPNTNGYSTTCTVTPSSGAALTYSCVAQLDNQNYDPNPNQSFTVQYQGNNLYSSVSCGITCGGPSPTPTITPSPTPTNTPTPTPTRTPTPTPTRTPTPSPTPVITTSNIDDNTLGTGQNQFEYVGNWTASTDASAYAGTDHYSNTTGAYFQVRFTGTQIKGYFYRATNVGIAGVSIDGGAETMVDLYSSGSGNALGYTSPTLTQGTHIIKFRVTGNKNASASDTYIDVDYMQVTSVIAKANIKPSIRSKPAVAAASTAIYDDSVEGTGLGQFEYVGNWTAGWDSGNYNGYDHFSNETNAYFNFRFNGNQVKLYFFEDNNMGYAAISIDGGTETNIDLYSSFFQFTVLAYTSPILADGNHTIRVRVTGQNNGTSSNTFLDVDRADVTSGLIPPPTSTPIPTPTTGAASAGLVGAYYNNIDFTAYAFTKVDSTINRSFTSGTPEVGISPGTWSARWTGYIVPQYTQTYTFYAVSDDGQRLYVNNQLLVDDWADHSATERTATIALTAGVAYPIKYEYYDNIAGSQTSLSWSSASVAKQIIPSTNLYTASPSGPTSTPTPTAAPAATAGLIGNYYNNVDFTAFALTKTDTTINRAFTSANPEAGVTAGTWSARWTGYVVPQYTQTYTFYALSDDGERLYVNNQLLVNDWNDHGATESSGNIALTAGVAYPITYEYYDNIAGSQYTLSWSSASQAKQVIPSTRLYTSNPTAPTSTPTPTATPTSTPTPTPTPVTGPIACTNIYTPTFDVNTGAATSKTMNLYFNLNDATAGGGGFYKVKNASYYDHDSISSVFPVNHQAYDTDDSPLVEHFNRGDDASNIVGAGVVMSNGGQNAGGVGGTYSGISPRGWTSTTYQQTAAQIGSNFITYLKNRRDLITITSLADAAYTSKTYGSFIVNGDLTISAADAAAFNNKNVVIAVSGNLNINTNLIPTAGNVAFIAQSIYINESVTEVRALLTGNTVSFASSAFVGKSANPLKIVGSVSSGTSVDTSKRSRTDSLKPSLFIVTNPDAYTSLLPLISVIKYDWTQLQ